MQQIVDITKPFINDCDANNAPVLAQNGYANEPI